MLGQKDVKSRILESLAASSVGAAWLLVMHSLKTLPDRIPTHFGLNGAANATGPASSLWILPIAISALYVFLSALQLVPNRSQVDLAGIMCARGNVECPLVSIWVRFGVCGPKPKDFFNNVSSYITTF